MYMYVRMHACMYVWMILSLARRYPNRTRSVTSRSTTTGQLRVENHMNGYVYSHVKHAIHGICIHTHICKDMRIVCPITCAYAYIHTRIQTDTHVFVYVCIHIYIHAHMYRYLCINAQVPSISHISLVPVNSCLAQLMASAAPCLYMLFLGNILPLHSTNLYNYVHL